MRQGQFLREGQICPAVELSPVTNWGVVTGDIWSGQTLQLAWGPSWGRSPSAPPCLKLLPDPIIPDRDFDSLHHLQPGEGP